MNDSARQFRIAVGFVTKGRASTLRRTVAHLAFQERRPDRILICHTCPEDVAGLDQTLESLPALEFLLAAPGLPKQRNKLLDAVPDCDGILFLDDDFLAAPRYLAATVQAFLEDPAIAVTTGRLIADGIHGPGLSFDEGLKLLTKDRPKADAAKTEPAFNGYGCNMALRLSLVREHRLRFDERLPLYAWYEDMDFTRHMRRYGAVVQVVEASGVHLGIKSGRVPGRQLGYSQIANPLYICSKGDFPLRHALSIMGKNVAANCIKALFPEPYIDRRGRLSGNLTAMKDLLGRRLTPERVLSLR